MDVRGVISKISRNKRRVLLNLFILCCVGAYFDCIFSYHILSENLKTHFFLSLCSFSLFLGCVG